MATGVKVKFNREQVVNAMRKVAAGAINTAAVEMQRHTRERLNQYSGWKSKPGGWPGNNSGTLSRSIRVATAKPRELKARMFSNAPQGAYTQYGSKASKGKGLTVPVHNKAARGLAAHGGIRGLARAEGLVFIKRSRVPGHIGTWVKVVSKGRKNQRVEPWVVLRKAVKARPWATLALREHRDTSVKVAKDFFKVNWQAEAAKIAATIGGKP